VHRLRRNLSELGLTVDLLILDERGWVIGGPPEGPFAELLGRDLRAAGWLAARPRGPGARPRFVREPDAAALVGFAGLGAVRPGWSTLAVEPLDEALARCTACSSACALCSGLCHWSGSRWRSCWPSA